MTQRHVAIRRDPEQAQARTTPVRLADTFVDLLDRIGDVREAVVFIAQGVLEPLRCELLELLEHRVLGLGRDRIVAMILRRDRCESHLAKAELIRQVPVDLEDVQVFLRERHPRADRA